jgi:hypothetical protein
MKQILTIILCLWCAMVLAQPSPVDKYWYYRHRLVSRFTRIGATDPCNKVTHGLSATAYVDYPWFSGAIPHDAEERNNRLERNGSICRIFPICFKLAIQVG